MNITQDDLRLISNTIKTLGMDAVQKANSGHPGIVMGCSDIAAVLWFKILKHNPNDPAWANRDRFVLSAGHGSMLLYSALHLSGYDITIEDIKKFRQFESKTPGHPEQYMTPGVETTTGPLGQGFANGVGMAIASTLLAGEFNANNEKIIDHYIYALVSDGDLNEGISTEAASLAGHMGLGNIIYIYDSNDITIEGKLDLAFSEDVAKKFEALNWHAQTIDGHSHDAIEKAIVNAQQEKNRPSIIIAKTTIAQGSPNFAGSEKSHGAPLGNEEIKAAKKNLGIDENKSFFVPERIYQLAEERKKALQVEYQNWNALFEKIITGDLRDKWNKFFSKTDIAKLRKALPQFDKAIATRSASGAVLEKLFALIPNLVGGSADLGPSNKSFVKGHSSSGKNQVGRNIHFGIREHAMGAIQNGMAYYGGFIPFGATFLVFLDYMRPAVRLAALSKLQAIYLFTHDSLFVGEDGPTHQPVEHLATARAIPNLTVIRPADACETLEAWLAALEKTDGPTILSLTRQDLPIVAGNGMALNLQKGAYIIKEAQGTPDIILLATGSEVHISIEAAHELEKDGIKVRVVSFPSWELFDKQSESYKNEILSHGTPKAVVEAGLRMGWEKYAGNHALYITMETFGTSAPQNDLAEHFGFTKDNIILCVKKHLKK